MAGSRSVLVIEPADDDRGSFADTLRRTGVPVDSTGDAARALAHIASNDFGIVVIDPTTLGLSIAALGDALKMTAPRPVVLVMIDDIEPVRGFGAEVIHGYIRRGDDGEQLAELIRDCLAALRDSKAIAPNDSANRQISAN